MAPVRQRARPGSYHLFEELLHIKHRLPCEDVVRGSGHFVSHNGQRFRLAMFLFESGTIKLCLFVSSQEQDDCLGESPFEVDVSDLSSRASHFLPGRVLGGFYEPAVGGEVLDFGESLDVVDFVEYGKTENTSYSRNGANSEVGIVIMLFGERGYFLFELRKYGVVVIEKVEVNLDALLDAFIRKELCDFFPFGLSTGSVFKVFDIVLIGGILDMRQKFGPFPGEMHSASQQVTGGAHSGRIDIGQRKHSTSREHGDLVGVDSVVLGLSSVDGFHVKGMSENEFDAFFSTQIGDPIPGEGAFDGNDKIVSVSFYSFQESVPVCFDVPVEENLPLAVNDAQIHGFCVQVDSAIILVLFRVEFHSVPPCGCWDLYHTFGYEQGGLNEYQGAVADMAHLQRRPRVLMIREIKAFVLRAGTQECHAAKLRRAGEEKINENT